MAISLNTRFVRWYTNEYPGIKCLGEERTKIAAAAPNDRTELVVPKYTVETN
jgi:hypothetical protein